MCMSLSYNRNNFNIYNLYGFTLKPANHADNSFWIPGYSNMHILNSRRLLLVLISLLPKAGNKDQMSLRAPDYVTTNPFRFKPCQPLLTYILFLIDLYENL